MSTDLEWVRWGLQDPYFAVITNEKFRIGKIDQEAKQEFFQSGRQHAVFVLNFARKLRGQDFKPARALDFGCGVGRITLGLAEWVPTVVGVDVSPHMLQEAKANATRLGLSNLEWLISDDELSAVTGKFDLVNTAITFQHIPPARGLHLFARLVDLIAPGGVGVLQVTYGKAYHPETFGQPDPLPPEAEGVHHVAAPPGADPEMQMNAYNLSQLAFVLQKAGVKEFNAEFTDHGGELGVFLYFIKP